MSRRIELMGHMVVDRMVVTGHIEMTQLEMEDCWTLRIGEGINICIILVPIQIGSMIIIVYHPYRRSDMGYFSDDFKK